eukprot:3859237-Rhodomonas_salina.1
MRASWQCCQWHAMPVISRWPGKRVNGCTASGKSQLSAAVRDAEVPANHDDSDCASAGVNHDRDPDSDADSASSRDSLGSLSLDEV